MAKKTAEEAPASSKTGLGRRDFLKFGGAASGAVLLGSTGVGRAFASQNDKVLKVGTMGWDENVALAYLTKVLLEKDLGYHVSVIRPSHGRNHVNELFRDVAHGSLDAFQDVWLPRTHSVYWRRYADQVEKLDSWYQGFATLGLAVPDYMRLNNVPILPAHRKELGRRIVGIEPFAGETRIVKRQLYPGYHLGPLHLETSSTPDMLRKLSSAMKDHKPIVTTLYSPHWAFTAYQLRYLEDPKKLLSGHDDRIYSVVRRKLQREKPDAYAFLKSINLSPLQLRRLELAIVAEADPVQGVKTWLFGDTIAERSGEQGNYNLVQPWIQAAKRAAQHG